MRAALVFVCSLVGAPLGAVACSCDSLPSIAEEVKRSDVIFSGRVVSMKVEKRAPEDDVHQVVVVEFDQVTPLKDLIGFGGRVTTPFQESACGYPFMIGAQYVVYAYLWNGELRTDICRRTVPFYHADLPTYPEAEVAARDLPVAHPGLEELKELRKVMKEGPNQPVTRTGTRQRPDAG